ncbi:MAG: apolipoprotein N-acyltransferase [Deltaproteobacteria bacterium]|uniref:Apolipoprotein N-acyltransferase n=1 Tax=Candidatus Zymogenus saltonus TaxID=2844893 RepID=A0A9D8KEG9_9DELT|nr:apolipoprotein N-acyltransferase [Candidatus Zymogenus saltonus]
MKPKAKKSVKIEGKMEDRPKWIKDVILAGFGGCLFFLSLPAPSISILAWICLVPLLFAVKDYSPYRASILGFVFGLFANLGVFYWTALPASRYGGVPIYLGILITVLLVLYVSIYAGVFSAFVSWTRERFGTSEIVSVPIALTALEYLRGTLFTGFPWCFIGHSQIPFLPVVQVLDITGVFGVTFTIAIVNAAVYLVFLKIVGARKKFPWAEVAVSASLVAILIAYGLYAINRETKRASSAPGITVSLIQGNIRQDIKWNPAYQDETVSIYEELTLSTEKSNPDLIVWSETATPFFFKDHPYFRPRVEGLAMITEAYLFFGTVDYKIIGEQYRYQNSAYLLNPEGSLVGKYDKTHLVPFAEYVPLKRLFFFVDKIVEGVGDYLPGEKREPLETGFGGLGSLVCYEAIFPYMTRDYAKDGAVLFINITNDAWFGKTSAPYQHFSMSRIRAIETRIPLVRCANTGVSAFVDTIGRVKSQTPIFKRTAVTDKVKIGNRLTFYTRFGDIFAQLVTLAFIFPLLVGISGIIRGSLNKKRKKK